MKLSDYVAKFLASKGVDKAFVLTGGCILHCIDSVAKTEGIQYIPVQNEQAGAMAADGYARVSGKLGLAMVTSGPGATNLLTGVCCSYYDSIPVMLITGQVPSGQLKRDSLSRQIGFQETDVVSIFKPVTKYAVLIDDPKKIRYELEKAYHIAFEGRPGPVVLDICDDIQRAEIDPEKLPTFTGGDVKAKDSSSKLNQLLEMIDSANRPVFIVGGAVRSANISNKVEEFLNKIKIPYTLTWGAMDTLSHESKFFVGGFGVTSGRPGNFAVQNADLLIAFGTRLDTHEVGTNIKSFGRAARKVVIDIDQSELDKYEKMGLYVDLLINDDVRNIIDFLLLNISRQWMDSENWLTYIAEWKQKYPVCLPRYSLQERYVNPYVFMESLSKVVNTDAIIVSDCGSNLIWTMQGFKLKNGQRLISAFNHSPMGYSLPASIGTYFAAPKKENICIIGDGGMQINVQELATIEKYNINIKIFILNNHGHGIIQGTQDNWLQSRYHASNPSEGGLPDPDFVKISKAYGIPAHEISEHLNLEDELRNIMNLEGPFVCVVHMQSGSQIAPKLLFGKPIEDSDPLLPRDEFEKNMIIPSLK
jgi:acetolactate synthase-1/2/3 large subunit